MDQGRVKSSTGLNLRQKPNGEKVGVLAHNERLDILEEVMFYRVKTVSGQVGYVHGNYVEKLPASEFRSELDDTQLSERFVPVTFNHDRFVGEKVQVDKDFVPALEQLAEWAKKLKLKIWVTSSTRALNNQVQGAIVPPASRSCHHIGHAIDMNLMHAGKLYNSKKLKRDNLGQLPASIQAFIDKIRADEVLRWGGDFSVEDPVHIDDDFYRKQKILYLSKLQSRVDLLNS